MMEIVVSVVYHLLSITASSLLEETWIEHLTGTGKLQQDPCP